MATRRNVSSRTRFRILQRDRFACRYCGRAAPEIRLEVDHVIAVANGGANTDDNLVASCSDCKSAKAIVLPPDTAQPADRIALPSKSAWPCGSFFFTFGPPPARRWEYSGQVVACVGEGMFQVEIFDAVMLQMAGRMHHHEHRLVALRDMATWEFHHCAENFWLAAKEKNRRADREYAARG